MKPGQNDSDVFLDPFLGWGKGKMGQTAFDLQRVICGSKAEVCFAHILGNSGLSLICRG